MGNFRNISLLIFLLVLGDKCHCIKVYQTCRDIKTSASTNVIDNLVDGYYFIQLQSGIGIQVYCTGMAPGSVSTPMEYINLPSGRTKNYGEFYKFVGSTSSCTLEVPPEETFSDFGKTEFEKLQFDPRTRSVAIDDFTFATNVGGGRKIKYGTGGDKHSYSSSCSPFGKFSIDLTGTPWLINSDISWKWTGTFANGDNTKGRAKIDQKTYLGCFIDQSPRDLPESIWHHSSVNGQVCSQHCREEGFEYAGTQYTDECYCGHTYGNFGEADESECDMPCAGDPNEMCGGVWRNSVYRTGKSQIAEGNCGGYPGSCSPTLSYDEGKEQIKLDIVEDHPCLSTPSPCYNDGVCVATDNDQFLCLCHTGYVGTYCDVLEEPLRLTSPASGTSDDAHAYVSCPPGMMAVKCECEGKSCDGAWFKVDECEVTNSAIGQTSKSVVTCLQYDPAYQRMINVESTNWHNPTAQCPEKSIMTGCAAVDPWYQKVTYGRGTVDNTTTPHTCKQEYCKTTPSGCKVQARCLLAECDCKNGGSCIHASGLCDCPKGYYGSKCESFDYCAFHEDMNNEPACWNGGSCVGVPSHVVATTGGTGNNQNCEFPFVYQNMSYAKCVEGNEVGPPFACGAMLNGIDSYIDFGRWNPGPIYTMEVWARAIEIEDGRHAVAGGFGDCRDWGIGMEGGKFKAFYNPPDSCTASIALQDPVQVNRWYYMVKVNDGQTAKFYVDGNLVGSATVAYMVPGTAVGFYAGGEQCCGNFFNGEIKSLRVWKRVLSQTDITKNYNTEHGFHDTATQDALHRGLVGYWDFGEVKHPPCSGVDHMGADWSVDDGEVLSGVHCNISRFLIPESHTVSVREWEGSDGSGKLEIYAKDIDIYGVLTANGKGYKGGQSPTQEQESGFQGESFSGSSDHAVDANVGGGGGGGGELDGSGGHGKPGGGGGYGTTGGTCKLRPDKDVSHCGSGGQSYGDEKLATLHLGSGGGSGGNDNALNDNPHGGRGGNGGGAIRLDALRRIEIVGFVEANGEIGHGDVSTSCDVCPPACTDQNTCSGGSTQECFDFSGSGGGGSGGSLYLRGQVVNVGLNHIAVNGGRGGHGAYAACGGDGARGRIRIDYVELIGKYPSHAYLKHYDSTFPDKSYIGQQDINIGNTEYGNEVYLGCHEDTSDRHMEYQVSLNDDDLTKLTPDFCLKKCREQGYKFSGTQNGKECFCDSNIGKFPIKNEGDCSTPCTGDDRQFCGGAWRLSVYGPPPTAGAATDVNGVIQSCRPWCKNGIDSSGSATWGECVNDGYISEYEARCECKPGFTGDDCGQTCPNNKWGQDCAHNCECIQDHTSVCEPVTGTCQCKDGFQGDRCQNSCPTGMWGGSCANSCSCVNSATSTVCEPTTGQCSCNAGFTGIRCDTACPEGKWGANCVSSCTCANGDCSPTDGQCTCYSGFSGASCDQECSSDRWGSNCVYQCDCNGHDCDGKTGTCLCPPTASGVNCQEGCPPNKWGTNCAYTCTCGSHSVGCDVSTGECVCEVGFIGSTCDSECSVGKFGKNCAYDCICDVANIERCDAQTGQCECKPGYDGVQCHTTCPSGKYGVLCSMTCQCDGTHLCDPVTGSCDKCPTGFIGANCQTSCPQLQYGDNCAARCDCSQEHTDSCDGVTGKCFCKDGYQGESCDESCPAQHWGPDCAYQCPCVAANTDICELSTGICFCLDSYTGPYCERCKDSTCTGTGCNCHNGGTCLSDGRTCDCAAGYYGDQCDYMCPDGMYGKDCASSCLCLNGAECDKGAGSCTCKPGFHGPLCEYKCSDGYFGQNCEQICQCVYGSCNSATGACLCNPGFMGNTCTQPCPEGKYGPGCASHCNCLYGICSSTTGTCLCEPGYTGSSCSSPCPANYFGENCAYLCPNCNENSQYGCDSATGACICQPGFKPPYCSERCSSGYWGQDCQNICQNPCLNGGACDSTTGTCNCPNGFQGVMCEETCDEGYYGPNCVALCGCAPGQSTTCDAATGACNCKPGFSGEMCEAPCASGKYGANCLLTCSCRMSTSNCDPVTGVCDCDPGYGGSDCSTPCLPGMWGKGCIESCDCSHFSSGCDAVSGTCSCLAGYTGTLCDKECPEGYYGDSCIYTCSCLNNGVCDHRNGQCQCQLGFSGSNCEYPCDHQHFGYNCAQLCSCQAGASCDPISGACSCPAGWTGTDCSFPCGSGFWGQGCAYQCPSNCPLAGQCDIITGLCICPDGFSGKYCNQTCPAGKWGPDCVESCFSPCPTECDTHTGGCLCGNIGASCKNGGSCSNGQCNCPDGYGGVTCTEPGQQSIDSGLSGGAIAAAVIVPILILIIVGLIVYLAYYKRSIDLSVANLKKSLDPTKFFSKQEDTKTLYSGDDKVTIDNPNYYFNDATA